MASIEQKKMTEGQLITSLNSMSKDASKYSSSLAVKDAELLDRYLGNLYGDEEEDRSKVVSNDVEDVVESDMVSMSRVFLGAGEIIEFTAKNPEDQAEVEEARIKTKYADWLIRKQKDSYATQSSILKDILIQKSGGVAKYMIEDIERPETKEWQAIDELELEAYISSLEGENVKSVKITEKSGEFNGQDTIDFKITVIHKEQRINIVAVPTGCFIISRNASSKDDAQIVGDDTTITRGELVAMGYSIEKVNKVPNAGDKADTNRTEQIRDNEEGGESLVISPTWASEEILLKTRYPKIDFDGDGIEERRYVLYAGDEIFENKEFDHVPYALGSAIILPHRAIGRSRAEQAAPFALQNTTILRGMFDNQYAVLTPRIAYNDKVDEDDLFDMEHGGGIKVEGDQHPGNSLMPVEIPYIGDKALQFMQFQGQRRAQTTGTLLASQGLEADDFSEETAARFNGVRDEGKGRIELVARNVAETYYRQLYEGVIWMATHFQNSAQEIAVTGKQLVVDPNEWKNDSGLDVKVGLGAGDDEKTVQTMSGLLNLSQQLKATNSPLTDDVKIYNQIDTMLKGMDINATQKYFNDPERPDQVLQFENEQLTAQLQQAMGAVEQLSQKNPLAEAEQVKAESKARENDLKAQLKLLEDGAKVQLQAAKLAEDQRQFDAKLAAEIEKERNNLVVKLAELELEHGAELVSDEAVNSVQS
jgi:hypothetical protein